LFENIKIKIKYIYLYIMARKRHSRKYRKRGGSYSSASSYQEYVNGNSVNDQLSRTFGNGTSSNGNLIIGAQGQNSTQFGGPTSAQLSQIQSAGKSRRKRGGIWGSVLNQAIVPFSILGLQQTYKRKHNGGKKSKRHHR
jgi:hypothetical protein